MPKESLGIIKRTQNCERFKKSSGMTSSIIEVNCTEYSLKALILSDVGGSI